MRDNASWFFSQAIAAENCFGALGLSFAGYNKNVLQSRGVRTEEVLYLEILCWSDLYLVTESTFKEWFLSHLTRRYGGAAALSCARSDNSHIQKAMMPTPMAETLGTGLLPFGASHEQWILDLYNKRQESCYLGGKSGTLFLHLPHCLCLCNGGLHGIWENGISFEVVVTEALIQPQGMGKVLSCTESFVCKGSAAEWTPVAPQGWSREGALCAVLLSLKCASWFIALTPSPWLSPPHGGLGRGLDACWGQIQLHKDRVQLLSQLHHQSSEKQWLPSWVHWENVFGFLCPSAFPEGGVS